MSQDGPQPERPIPPALANAIVFLWRSQILRPIALLLARARKTYYAYLIDLRAEEEKATKKLGWWWLSFSDPKLPPGQRFLGVVIVEGHGVASAAIRANELGINPGGGVQSIELKGDRIPAEEFRNRLLDGDELKRTGLV
jgi:hypothetical protein